jgi:hypothetical protein
MNCGGRFESFRFVIFNTKAASDVILIVLQPPCPPPTEAYTMNSTIFRKTTGNKSLLTRLTARQSDYFSIARNTTKVNTFTMLPPPPPPIFSSVRCYHSTTKTWQQQQHHQSKEDNEKANVQQDEVKEDIETPSSNNNGTTTTSTQPSHGTATITFVETEESLSFPTSHDDDGVGAHKEHPMESLLGGDPSAYTVPIVVKMPDMSDDDDDQSVIEKWYKQPGDIIKRNDILCDIATPAFTFGMVTEDEDDAIMGDIHVMEGDSAVDNSPICTIYHLPDDHETKKKKSK